HRLRGFDPEPSGLAPSRRVEEADLDAAPPGLPDGPLQGLPPGLAHEGHIAHRRVGYAPAVVDVPDVGAPDADPRHGLQVAGDSLGADVVVDPVPVAAGAGVGGRVEKIPPELLQPLLCRGAGRI